MTDQSEHPPSSPDPWGTRPQWDPPSPWTAPPTADVPAASPPPAVPPHGGPWAAPPLTTPASPWPSTPPSGSSSSPSGAGAGGGPAFPPSPVGTTGSGGPPRRRRGGLVAGGVVVALALAAGGVVAGTQLADHNGPAGTAATATQTQPVTTQIPPLKGDATEPAEAVAKVLGPAVVQIETDQGLGSGFVYDKSGLILTAGHVTDGATQVQVRMADGTKTTGKVLGQDNSTDVAVVKIDPPSGMVVATLATGVTTQVGQTAIAIGSPFGLDQTVTAGIVSAVGRSVETPGGVIPAVQTDAPINSGNSGGALADRQGRVIGINDSIVTGSASSGSGNTGNVGVGFAIPIDIAKPVADKIVAGQSTKAGFLGVEGADATGARSGAAITKVEPGSPAAQAGITDSDVVTAVDGKPVSSMIDLAAAIRTGQPGDKLTLTIDRSGKERTVVVTLGAATGN